MKLTTFRKRVNAIQKKIDTRNITKDDWFEDYFDSMFPEPGAIMYTVLEKGSACYNENKKAIKALERTTRLFTESGHYTYMDVVQSKDAIVLIIAASGNFD